MKNLSFLLLTIMVSILFSCKQSNTNETEQDNHMHQDTTMVHNDEQMMNSDKMYSCPMHPEVKGNKDEKCTKCGMDLTMTSTQTSEEDK